LNRPDSAAYDPIHNRLFVSDEYNCRVLEYDASNVTDGMDAEHVLGQTDFGSSNCDSTAGTFDDPMGLTFDSVNQMLYVTDEGDRIVGFPVASITDGEPATEVLGVGDFVSHGNLDNSQSEFGWYGENISIDPGSGNLYVADWHEHRVMDFRLARLVSGGLNSATAGQVYSDAIGTQNTQGTATFARTSGSLPPGISLASDGSLSGTPSAAGAYVFSVELSDNNGLVGTFTDTRSYSIVVASQPSSPNTPSSGNSSQTTPTDTTTSSVTSTPVQLNDQPDYFTDTGTSQTLAASQSVTFTIPASGGGAPDSAPETHTVTVDSVGADYADITVASDPINFRLYIGNSRSVDVDRDGLDDLMVTLRSIVSGKAQLTFKGLSDAARTVSTPAGNAIAAPNASASSPSYLPWIMVGIAAVILVAATLVWRVKLKRTAPLNYQY
jgi:hypothetical protein